ncbi:MAG: response regulator [Syntrophobacteraceae bacterium]|nr:response regulator [Syntrophobacteraceae bacterium]
MSYRVLLVDDERRVTDGLRRALHAYYTVHCAPSARDALFILNQEKIDVVVTDEIMPGMSGTDLLKEIYARYPDTIRIILTGNPNLDTALRSINQGHVYRFFIKPCSGVELHLAIRQGLQQRELSKASIHLLDSFRRQERILKYLERRYPGITEIDTDRHGVIAVDYTNCDLDNLIDQINTEYTKSICSPDEQPAAVKEPAQNAGNRRRTARDLDPAYADANQPSPDELFRVLFDHIPSIILAVDHDVRIMECNNAAADLLGAKNSMVLQMRGGDAFHCIHSHDAPQGCGHGPHCGNCVIRNSVNDAFKGNNVVRRRHKMEVIKDGQVKEIFAMITASKVAYKNLNIVLLIIEDIT